MDELIGQLQFETSQIAQADNSSSSYDAFGCCSRYRQCSDAGACIIPNLDYSKSCLYRKSLEAGNIFYGKNATDYDAKKYQFFLDQYSALDRSEISALCDILHYFFIKKNGVCGAMFFDAPEIFSLARSGFFSLDVYPAKIVNKCKLSAMKSACGERISDAISWAEANCKPKDWAKRKGSKIYRDELAKWILKFDPNAVSILCNGIHFINIASGSRLELLEFFFDHIYQEGYSPALSSCENDPRFLLNGKD